MTPANIHVGIDTSDLRKLCDVLEKEGVTFIHPFKQRSDGMGFSAWIRDPDGHELDSPNDIRAHNRVAAACNLVRAAVVGIVSRRERARLLRIARDFMKRREFLRLAGISALSGASILSGCAPCRANRYLPRRASKQMATRRIFHFVSLRSISNLHPKQSFKRLATTVARRGLCYA